MDADLLDDLADQILRGTAIDRHPAKRAHETPDGSAKQALLADEAHAPTDRVDRAQEHREIPIAGVRCAENDEFAIGREGAMRGPAASTVPLQQQPQHASRGRP